MSQNYAKLNRLFIPQALVSFGAIRHGKQISAILHVWLLYFVFKAFIFNDMAGMSFCYYELVRTLANTLISLWFA